MSLDGFVKRMKRITVTITIPEPIVKIIDELVKRGNSNRSEIINAVLEEALVRKPAAFKELLKQSGGTSLVLGGFCEDDQK